MDALRLQAILTTNDATGVPVSIDAVDPNGNYIHLGDATSDASGRYHFDIHSKQPQANT